RQSHRCTLFPYTTLFRSPISLRLLKRVYKNKNLEKDFSYEPTVTIMIVAHNEEKVILEKLENVLKLYYPKEKVEVLIASDNSTEDRKSTRLNSSHVSISY